MTNNKKKPKKASMQDVANLAGVSRTTVSFVINKVTKGNIPEETQQRVWKAVEALNYRPNALARGLRNSKTNTIGFITDEVATTPFAGQILQGAQDLAWQHEILLLTVNTGGNQAIKETAVSTLLERQVDGIIYATMYHRQVNPPQILHQLPAVLLDCFVKDASITSVIPDDYQGGFDATKYLITKGHRKIGFVCDQGDAPARYARYQGYQDALQQNNLPFHPSYVAYGPSTPPGAAAATKAIFDSGDPPTALFCYNDRMAMGAYQFARDRSLAIPHDLAIIGYDNLEIIAPYLNPPLTTMQLPHYKMGKWEVEKILQLINSSESAPQTPIQHKLPCPIIIRDSV